MDNLINFFRMFNSYLLVVIVAAVVMAIAVTIGITLRKHKNTKVISDAQECETEN